MHDHIITLSICHVCLCTIAGMRENELRRDHETKKIEMASLKSDLLLKDTEINNCTRIISEMEKKVRELEHSQAEYTAEINTLKTTAQASAATIQDLKYYKSRLFETRDKYEEENKDLKYENNKLIVTLKDSQKAGVFPLSLHCCGRVVGYMYMHV